jgi:hypothetical protein
MKILEQLYHDTINTYHGLTHWVHIRNNIPSLLFNTATWDRLESVMDLLNEIYQEKNIYNPPENADFLLFTGDCPHSLPEKLTPVMHFASLKNDSRVIPIPYGIVGKCGPENINGESLARLNEWGKIWQQPTLNINFHDRHDILYWRGGITPYRQEISKKISNIANIEMHFSPLEGILPLVNQNNFKYIMDMKGIGWSSRLQFLFWMGAVIFILDRDEHEFWFRDNFLPWVHYVPVKQDASDLEEVFNMVRSMPDKGKSIADAAFEKAKEIITEEFYKHYFAKTLRAFTDKYQTLNI